MIAIDTNLLVYAHRSATPEHRSAKLSLERAAAAADGWGMTFTNLLEFWSIVTHPAASGRPSTPAEAAQFIRGLMSGGLAGIWVPDPGFPARLMRIAEDLKITGARVFDLTIALTAFEAGAGEIWTNDSGFRSVPGLRVVLPLRKG
jgi:toxin-antitoxin system PIN domain toxin